MVKKSIRSKLDKLIKPAVKTLEYSKKDVMLFKVHLANSQILLDIQNIRRKRNIPVKIDSKIFVIPNHLSTSLFSSQENHFSAFLTSLLKEHRKLPKKNIVERVKFTKEIESLMLRHNMPSKFEHALKTFIKTGNIHLSDFTIIHDQSSVSVFKFKKPDGKECVALEIEPDTTIKEIQKRWPAIQESRNKYLGFNPQKQANRKNIDRDLKVVQLVALGDVPKIIVKKINSEFKSNNITLPQVYKIINSLKNRLDLKKKPLFSS